jgi:hypothetical protein
MTFEPGDKVRVRGWPYPEKTVKLVCDGYILCETRTGSGINVGAWPTEALELVKAVERGPSPPPDPKRPSLLT